MQKVTITLEEIEAQLVKSGIKPEFGVVYNLYDCGCTIDNEKDEQKIKHNYDTQQRVRCCSKCMKERGKGFLIIKYKKCQCGHNHISRNTHASDRCKFCPPLPQVGKFNKAKAKRKKLDRYPFKKIYNAAFQDATKWDCFFRDNCADYYIKHRAIPCKDCPLYQKNPNII